MMYQRNNVIAYVCILIIMLVIQGHINEAKPAMNVGFPNNALHTININSMNYQFQKKEGVKRKRARAMTTTAKAQTTTPCILPSSSPTPKVNKQSNTIFTNQNWGNF